MSKSIGRKSIFVTGAASGIGKATAKLFADRSWFVGLYDIDETGLKTLVQEIGEENCVWKKLDVRSREDWAAGMEHFSEATGGKLDVLFNNAGIGGPSAPIGDYDIDAWHKVLDVDLHSVFYCMKYELAAIEASGGGRRRRRDG